MSQVREYTFRELQDMTENFSDKYRIGSGKYSIVRKGENAQGLSVAIKEFTGENRNEARKQYETEKNFLSSDLQHHNINQLMGYTDTQTRIFLIMELQDTDLLTIHKTLGWIEIPKILLQLAAGIEKIHGCKTGDFIHFDIKPDNILLDHKHTVKICDFGSVGRKGDYKVCTEGYAAPEIEDAAKRSQKCDIYSYGIIALQIIMRLGNNEIGKTPKIDPLQIPEVSRQGGKGKRKEAKKDKPDDADDGIYKRALKKKSKNGGPIGHIVAEDLMKDGCTLTEARNITKLAMQCADFNEQKRPTIKKIIEELNNLKTPQDPAQ